MTAKKKNTRPTIATPAHPIAAALADLLKAGEAMTVAEQAEAQARSRLNAAGEAVDDARHELTRQMKKAGLSRVRVGGYNITTGHSGDSLCMTRDDFHDLTATV